MNNLSPCLWTFHIKDTHSFSLCKSVGPTSRQLDQVPALGVSPQPHTGAGRCCETVNSCQKGNVFQSCYLVLEGTKLQGRSEPHELWSI